MFKTPLLFMLLLTGPLAFGQLAQADWKDWLESAREAVGQSQRPASGALSHEQMVRGLKEALRIGSQRAIGLLGRQDGYLNDSQVSIPLPDALEPVAKGLRAMGQGQLVDEFVVSLNRAAERAIPETLTILGETISQMSLQDAQGILAGSDTAATDYFKRNSSDRLSEAILPIVRQATEQAGTTSAYKQLLGQVGFLGAYIDTDALDLDRYVTSQALDGLFLKLAEQEQLIRNDPLARTTDILKTVFDSAGN